MSRRVLTVSIWLGLLVVFFGFYEYFSPSKLTEMTLEAGFEEAREHKVVAARLKGDWVELDFADATAARARLGNYRASEVRSYLTSQGVAVGEVATDASLVPLVLVVLGALVIAALVVLRLRSQGGLSSIWSLRRTNAKLIDAPPAVTFDDVGGNEDAKLRLRDVVGFLREPQRWQKTGARPPRGVLLEGAPGLGKTLLARALAGEAKVPLFTGSGADFVELFVGVGGARVRDLFETAQKKAPCIIFIDELDALARKRGSASASLTHQEREQALNQLLVCMDGFTPLTGVIVVAATNRSDVLDPALLRPGRFDLRLKLGPLSEPARRRVLELHTRKKALAPNVDLGALAACTDGLTGAELEHLANEAALIAVRAGGDAISGEDFDAALKGRDAPIDLDRLDAAMIEGSNQLSRPAAAVHVTVTLDDGELAGELLWVDPQSLKLKTARGPVVVSRLSIRHLVAAAGTAPATLEELQRSVPEVGTA